MFVFIGKRHW